MSTSRSVLIIVENLNVPLDRRVWQEARTLREAGYTVSVICPKGGKYTKAYELLEGIHIFRHPLPFEADGALGYAIEYGSALLWEFALSIKAYFMVGFDFSYRLLYCQYSAGAITLKWIVASLTIW